MKERPVDEQREASVSFGLTAPLGYRLPKDPERDNLMKVIEAANKAAQSDIETFEQGRADTPRRAREIVIWRLGDRA
jgi:hypothetical protein